MYLRDPLIASLSWQEKQHPVWIKFSMWPCKTRGHLSIPTIFFLLARQKATAAEYAAILMCTMYTSIYRCQERKYPTVKYLWELIYNISFESEIWLWLGYDLYCSVYDIDSYGDMQYISHVVQGNFTGTGAIIWLPPYDCPSASKLTLKNMGITDRYQTTSKCKPYAYCLGCVPEN